MKTYINSFTIEKLSLSATKIFKKIYSYFFAFKLGIIFSHYFFSNFYIEAIAKMTVFNKKALLSFKKY